MTPLPAWGRCAEESVPSPPLISVTISGFRAEDEEAIVPSAPSTWRSSILMKLTLSPAPKTPCGVTHESPAELRADDDHRIETVAPVDVLTGALTVVTWIKSAPASPLRSVRPRWSSWSRPGQRPAR